jgi:threonine synthase
MKYISTRSNVKVNASQAIYDGLSKEGGLYTFEAISSDFFSDRFYDQNQTRILKDILSYFLSDFEDQDIERLVQITQSDEFQPAYFSFSHFSKVSFLNLFHGPTYSFKDMALTLLPHMLEMAKKNLNIDTKSLILTATSGDTGSAALSGFQALDQFDTWVLYPKQGISEFQEKHMHSLVSKRAHLIPLMGNFDDCQSLVKHALSLPRTIHISSANSINIGRIIAQIAYYMVSYVELVRTHVIQKDERVNVIVPSGNFGNMYAAYVAKKMGVPFHDLIVASNENDVLTELFQEGVYRKSRPFHVTMSPSMDISVSSNIERLLWDIRHDHEHVSQWMHELSEHGSVLLPQLKGKLYAYRASEAETSRAISKAYETFKLVIDPHTAVAYDAHLKHQANAHTMIVSTASPYKFSHSVLEALHHPAKDLTHNFEMLNKMTPYDARMSSVLDVVIHEKVYTIEEAKHMIEKLVV